MPAGVEDSTSLVPPQLPEWLYKVVTMPVPQLSTAFDPRTGRRIVPNEPLIGLARSYLTTNQSARRSEEARPYVDGTSPLPDVNAPEAPSAERWPFSETPAWLADVNSDLGGTTAQHANPEPIPDAAIGNAWPQPPIDGSPYTEADSAQDETPWPTLVMPQPVGVAPAPSVGPIADSNFILANADDADDPQAAQRMLASSNPCQSVAIAAVKSSNARSPRPIHLHTPINCRHSYTASRQTSSACPAFK